MRHPLPPIECAEPINRPLSSDDVLAHVLSVIRGRVFGARATEVNLINEVLRRCGFEIVRRAA